MSFFRQYLIGLRRAENDGLFINLSIVLLIISIIGIGAGIAADLLLSPNYLINSLKGAISIVTGIALFSSSFLILSRRTDKILLNDKFYNPIRKRFSYKQRVNISIVLGVMTFLIVLLGSVESPTYTLKSSLFIYFILSLLAFTRRTREEFIKDIHEIPDVRDMAGKIKAKKKAKEKESE